MPSFYETNSNLFARHTTSSATKSAIAAIEHDVAVDNNAALLS